MERIHVLEEEKEELEERCKQKHERRSEKEEKGKEGVEDTERMLLAVLRELEGIPRCNMSSSPSPPCMSHNLMFCEADNPTLCQPKLCREVLKKFRQGVFFLSLKNPFSFTNKDFNFHSWPL